MKIVIVALWIVLPCSVSAQARQPAPLLFQQDLDTFAPVWYHVPVWRGGLLLHVENNPSPTPVIDVTDRHGAHRHVSFELPDSNNVFLHSPGAGEDGSIVVAGEDQHGPAFLAWISPDRKQRFVIPTPGFRADEVTIAADGAIWAVGNRAGVTNVIQRYSTSGTLLSSRRVSDARSATGLGNSWLVAAPDRVGWMTNGRQYIEFSLDGAELRRLDGPPAGATFPHFQGVGLSRDGDLVVSERLGSAVAILALDRASLAWSPVSLPDRTEASSIVLGFDGDTLVATVGNGVLHRYPIAGR